MARTVRRADPVRSLVQHGSQLDRLQREAANPTPALPAMFQLAGVDAFKVRHNQHIRFNRATGKWEAWNPPDLPYGFVDPPATGETFAYRFRDETYVTGFSLTAKTAGTSTSQASLKKNGTNIVTVTLGSGATYANALVTGSGLVVGILFSPRVDTLTVSLDTVGTGVVGLGGGIEIN